ncbi:hypothetical protein [Methanomethylovorans sp.]|uniref:hypothetical protein n=1 Tax=Methanomethylovorans sp. TaxID=2758717 RepID=UPI00351C1D80
MSRVFNDMDKQIFSKVAPELKGNTISSGGHNYPFILRPLSHKIAESAEDFRERIERLNAEELDYLVKLALENKEDIRSLEPEDIVTIMELVEQKISAQRMKDLKQHLGIV